MGNKTDNRLLSHVGRAPGTEPPRIAPRIGSREELEERWRADMPKVVATCVALLDTAGAPVPTRALLATLARTSARGIPPMAKRDALIRAGYVACVDRDGPAGLWNVTERARSETKIVAARPLVDERTLRLILQRNH